MAQIKNNDRTMRINNSSAYSQIEAEIFREYEIVKLSRDISDRLPAGTEGTVLIVYNEPALPIAYEVEFLDEDGRTIDILTLEANDLVSSLNAKKSDL